MMLDKYLAAFEQVVPFLPASDIVNLSMTCKANSKMVQESVLAQLVLHELLYDVDVDHLYPDMPIGEQLRRLVEVEYRLNTFKPVSTRKANLPKGADVRWLKDGCLMVQVGGKPYTGAMMGDSYEFDLLLLDRIQEEPDTHEAVSTSGNAGEDDGLWQFVNSAYDPKRKLLATAEAIHHPDGQVVFISFAQPGDSKEDAKMDLFDHPLATEQDVAFRLDKGCLVLGIDIRIGPGDYIAVYVTTILRDEVISEDEIPRFMQQVQGEGHHIADHRLVVVDWMKGAVFTELGLDFTMRDWSLPKFEFLDELTVVTLECDFDWESIRQQDVRRLSVLYLKKYGDHEAATSPESAKSDHLSQAILEFPLRLIRDCEVSFLSSADSTILFPPTPGGKLRFGATYDLEDDDFGIMFAAGHLVPERDKLYGSMNVKTMRAAIDAKGEAEDGFHTLKWKSFKQLAKTSVCDGPVWGRYLNHGDTAGLRLEREQATDGCWANSVAAYGTWFFECFSDQTLRPINNQAAHPMFFGQQSFSLVMSHGNDREKKFIKSISNYGALATIWRDNAAKTVDDTPFGSEVTSLVKETKKFDDSDGPEKISRYVRLLADLRTNPTQQIKLFFDGQTMVFSCAEKLLILQF